MFVEGCKKTEDWTAKSTQSDHAALPSVPCNAFTVHVVVFILILSYQNKDWFLSKKLIFVLLIIPPSKRDNTHSHPSINQSTTSIPFSYYSTGSNRAYLTESRSVPSLYCRPLKTKKSQKFKSLCDLISPKVKFQMSFSPVTTQWKVETNP